MGRVADAAEFELDDAVRRFPNRAGAGVSRRREASSANYRPGVFIPLGPFYDQPSLFGRPSLGLPHSVSTSSTNMNPRSAKIAANSMCGRLPQQNARNPR